MNTIPEAAIIAGAMALGYLDVWPPLDDPWGSDEENLRSQSLDVLTAAMPHIREHIAAEIERVRTFARQQHDEIKAKYDLTGAVDSHRHGYMSACADILAILDPDQEGGGE